MTQQSLLRCDFLWNTGVVGIPAAIRALEESDDPLVSSEICDNYLEWTDTALSETNGTIRDTLQN